MQISSIRQDVPSGIHIEWPERGPNLSPLQQQEEETDLITRINMLNVFTSIGEPGHHGMQQQLDYIRNREWRSLPDSRVATKLEQRKPHELPLPTVVQRVQDLTCPFRNRYEHQEFSLPLNTRAFIALSQGDQPKKEDYAFTGCMDTRIGSVEKHVQYFFVLDGHEGPACMTVVSHNFHRILRESLRQLPSSIMHSPPGRERPPLQTQDTIIWNALKLTIVKLQELWVIQYLLDLSINEKLPSSGTTLCAIVRIDNDVWCVNIGDSQAIAYTQNSYMKLSQEMQFDEKMARSILKRGGSYGPNPSHQTLVLNGSELSMPRSIGDVYVSGLAARPKVTKFSLTGNFEKCSVCIASHGVWKVFPPESIACYCNSVSPEEAIEGIVVRAANVPKADNIAMVLCHLERMPT